MQRRLVRNTRSSVVAGVAAGFADYFDLDPVIVRLVFVCLCLFGGSGILLYLISWVLMPADVDVAWAPSGSPGAAAAGGGAPPPTAEGPSSGEASNPAGGFAEKMSATGERLGREAAEAGQRVAREAKQAGDRLVSEVRGRSEAGQGRKIAGILLIVIGLFFLADRFLPFQWWWIGQMWPVALIVVGLAMILGMGRGAGR